MKFLRLKKQHRAQDRKAIENPEGWPPTYDTYLTSYRTCPHMIVDKAPVRVKAVVEFSEEKSSRAMARSPKGKDAARHGKPQNLD
jgi:hypothetical protein